MTALVMLESSDGQLVARAVTDPHTVQNQGLQQNTVVSDFSPEVAVTTGSVSADIAIAKGGAATAVTVNGVGTTRAGYAAVNVSSGTAPYGTAVFSFRLTTDS